MQASLASMEVGVRNVGPVSLFSSPINLPVFEVTSLPPRSSPGKMRTLDLLELALEEALADAGMDSFNGMPCCRGKQANHFKNSYDTIRTSPSI